VGTQSVFGQTAPDKGPAKSRMPERIESPKPGVESQTDARVSSDDIKKAKEALKAKGIDPGPINGAMDSKTQQALRQFQKTNKLPVTGTLDSKTAEKLGVTLGTESSMLKHGDKSRK